MSYFSEKELSCKHCGGYVFDEDFLDTLNSIRTACGFPLPVSSGYRCIYHPIEAEKPEPGAHCTGKAVDILVSGEKALTLIEYALAHGIKRIGINQKGNARFIHLDAADDFPSPAIWSY